jgi:hypothetical protein
MVVLLDVAQYFCIRSDSYRRLNGHCRSSLGVDAAEVAERFACDVQFREP